MGKLLTRFTARKDPASLENQALNFVRTMARAAVGADQNSFEAAYEETLAAIKELTSAEFERLIQLAYEEANTRTDSEEVVDEMRHYVESVSQELLTEEGACHTRLLSIPIIITGNKSAWTYSIPAERAQAIVQALKDNHIVVPDADITLFPRMMLPIEAERLLYGCLRQLLEAGYAGDRAAMADVLQKEVARLNIGGAFQGPHLDNSLKSTVGVLGLVVQTLDPQPFPLAYELSMALPESESEDEELTYAEMSDEQKQQITSAFEDVRKILEPLESTLQAIFEAEHVEVGDPFDSWFEGVAGTRKVERNVVVRNFFRNICVEQNLDFTDLCVSDDTEPANPEYDGYLLLRVFNKHTHQFLKVAAWTPIANEESSDCVLALQNLLSSLNIEFFSEEPGPLVFPEPESKVLH